MSEDKLFDETPGQALIAQNDAAAVARATQEIQAALVIGQRRPRDEIKSKAKILQACKRRELAEVAEYEYSRGGTKITGPTIDLLRAIANRWGNLRFGWEEVERMEGQSKIRCQAWDVENNSQAFRVFIVKHWRDTSGGGYELKDERDIYEMLANSAARRVRACLEEVIDSDIVSAAVEQCRFTLKSDAKSSMADRLVKLVGFFAPYGITQTMMETRLGNKFDAVSENQYGSLVRVWKSLKDGVGTREDYFKAEPAKPDFKPQAETAAEAAAGLAPEQPAPTNGGGFNPLRALRELCKVSKIKEADLLALLASDGTTDGSHGSLDEIMISPGGKVILRAACDNWVSLAVRLTTKGGAK